MTETFVITSESKNLKPLRHRVRRLIQKSGLLPRDMSHVLMAISEVCSNSIRHSYEGISGKKIRVRIKDQRNKIEIRVRDYGKKIDFSKVKMPVLPPTKPHGLGIYFLKTTMDYVRFNTRHARGTEVILIKLKRGF